MQTPLTRQQSRAVDTLAIRQYGIPGMVLMENAGRGVVDVLFKLDPNLSQTKVALFCGKGNNAGDGFVVARHLAIRGARPHVLLLASPTELRGDAKQNYQILTHCNVPIINLTEVPDLASSLDAEASDAAWLVDAMLGTGAQGEPRASLPIIIDWMNAQDAKRLALDIPSGLDCDTGQPASHCVRAHHTCTFVAPKTGFTAPAAQSHLGQIHTIAIGIPSELIATL